MREPGIARRRPIWQLRARPSLSGALKSIAGTLTITRVAVVLLAVLLGAYVYRDVTREVLIIQPFNVPKQYADMGLTGEVVANHISDSMQEIEKESITAQRRVGLKLDSFILSGDVPPAIDVEVPGTKLSLNTIVELVREVFGFQPKQVRGDVSLATVAANSPIVITVRVSGLRRAEVARRVTIPVNDPQQVPVLAAQAILRDVNPFILGVYQYLQNDMDSLGDTAHEMIRDADPVRRAYGHDFIGLVESWNGRWNHALAEYRQVTVLAPGLSFAYANWGQMLLQLGKPDEAIGKYRQAIAIDPLLAPAYSAWGYTLYKMDKAAEGDAKFQEAVQRDPRDASIYANWGAALSDQKKWTEAIAKFTQAVELDPRYWDAYLSWGRALANQDKWNEAAEKYAKAIEILPRSAQPLIDWGVTFQLLKKYADAAAQFRAALDLEPKNVTAYNWWAETLNSQGKPAEAIEKCRNAVKIDPDNDGVYAEWGRALILQGKIDEAKVQYEKSAALTMVR